MKLYLNKNNPNHYQIGAAFEDSILAPEYITLSDLPFLTIEEVITIEQEQISDPVFDEENNEIQPAQFQDKEIITYNFIIDEVSKLAAASQRSKEAQVTEAYNVMNNTVYSEMAKVFGTTKSDSATAFYETWKLMKEKPYLFVNKVVVDKDIAGFISGQVLSVELDIQNYADARINEAEAYSVFRLTKINEFYAQRAQILGE